jgi:hypothetical protein
MKALPGILVVAFFFSCTSSKKLKTGASKITSDSTMVKVDTMLERAKLLVNKENEIPFETFSAKAKLEYEDVYGKQPETNVYVRMEKDKFIWVSITATFLNIEAARVMVLPDSVIIVNKLDKTIETYPISFIREKIALPLAFEDIQKLIAGDIILTGDSVTSVLSSQSFLQITSELGGVGNNIFFTLPAMYLARQIIDVRNSLENYSADIQYEDYVKSDNHLFSTTREISIPAQKQNIKLTFRQYEFNKELSVPFSRPADYTTK